MALTLSSATARSAQLDRSGAWCRSAVLYSGKPVSPHLGVAIAQTTYATDESSETADLKRPLSGIELSDVLVQADALHGNRPLFSSLRSRAPTSRLRSRVVAAG